MSDKIEQAQEPTDVGVSPMTEGQAQAELLKMLTPEEDTANDDQEFADELSDEDGEATEDDFDDDTDEDIDEGDDDAELLEDDEETDDAEPEAQQQTFTVKVDGEEIEVDIQELKSGYSRQADYTRKSQALAEDRKNFQQDRDAVTLERQQYAQLLGALQTQLGALEEAPPDFDRMYDEDPIEAARQERTWNKRQQERHQKLAAIQAEQHRVGEANQKQQQEALQEMLNQEVLRLTDMIPAWKDEAVAKRESDELRTYLAEQGISEEEMGALVRANHITVLRKAMLFDKGQRRVKKASKAKRKNSVQPGAKSVQAKPSSKRVRTRRERLAKTGRVEDATALIESLLN